MELAEIQRKRKVIRELSPLQERLRKMVEQDRKNLGLTKGEYAGKIGISWRDVDYFEQKKKVITSRGSALSAICKHLKQKDLQDKITELYDIVQNDRLFGLSLFTPSVIDLVFDIHECQSKNSMLSFETFAKLFGADAKLVLDILNLNQEEIAKLADDKLYERLIDQLAGDEFSELIRMAVEEEVNALRALAKRSNELRLALADRFSSNRLIAEAIGIHVTAMGDVLKFEGPQSRKIYRATAEKLATALEELVAGKIPQSKKEAEEKDAEEVPPSDGQDIPGAKELETNVRALLNSGMEKQALADMLGIPRQSMAHILIRRASAERVNKLLPITRDLLKQNATKSTPPIEQASPKSASNGSAEMPARGGEEKFYPVTNALVNALRNNAKALEICVATSGMVPRDREKHELARIVLMLADLGQLTAADLRDASDGRPLKDSPAALAMLQSLRG